VVADVSGTIDSVSDDSRQFCVHEQRYTGYVSLGIGPSALGIEVVVPTRTQQLGLIIVLAALVAYVFIRAL